MSNNKKWGTIREAVAYYDVATHTIHSWRRTGKIESKEAPYGKRMGYKYLLDPELKEVIDAVKIYDKRWG